MKAEIPFKVFLIFVVLLFLFFVADLCLSNVIFCDSSGCKFVPAIQLIPIA